MKNSILVALVLMFWSGLTTIEVFPQQKPLGDFTNNADVGNPTRKGSASYDSEKQENGSSSSRFFKDVDPAYHPFYKHVYIRVMPMNEVRASCTWHLNVNLK